MSPEAPTGQPDASLAGEPGTLPPTWCRSCKETVTPEEKGVCPKCRRFLRRNFVAREHPQNRLRVDQLRDQLIGEYAPKSMMVRSAVDALAVVLEKLENIRAGSTEHARLVEAQAALFKTLNASISGAKDDIDLSGLTADELIEHAEEIIEMLVRWRDKTTTYTPTPTLADLILELDGDIAKSRNSGSREPTAAPAPALCPYGCGSLTRCDDLRRTRLDVWRINHHNDPEEVERRNREATAQMMRQIGRPPTW